MKAQQVESIPEEDRGRETVAYPARDEEDLEQILEQAHTVEDEGTAEAVENINGVVDDELRGVVRNHFQAPIRSLNNPQENSVELEDGTEAQVVGEEYFVNQNLPGFQDVGNIKWWTVYDDGTYREETSGDRSGEHLQFSRDGDLHGFYVELDGEPLDPEQTQRLARNLRIRRDNQVTTENNIPEKVLEHSNITEAVEASEDYDREDFESEYEEAQELGLVTESGNLTLKGWLSALDMEARDVRELEEAANGRNIIEPETSGIFDTLTEGTTKESLTAELRGFFGRSMTESSYELDVETEQGNEPWIESSPLTQFVRYDGPEDNPFAERQSFSLNQFVRDYFSEDVVQDEEIILEDIREHSDEFAESLIYQAESDHHETEYSSISVEEPSIDLLGLVDERGLDRDTEVAENHRSALESIYGISFNELNEELRENSTVNIDGDKLSISYEGEIVPDPIVRKIEEERKFEIENGEFKLSSFKSQLHLNTSNILLEEFSEELEEHNYDLEWENPNSGSTIGEYQDLSLEIKQRLNELENHGVIETDEKEVEPAKVEFNPENEEDYRIIDKIHRETDIEVPTSNKELKPAKIEGDVIRVDCDIIEDAQYIDERLDEEQAEILRLLDENDAYDIWTNYGRETEFGYIAQGINKEIHELADKNSVLKGLRNSLVGRPERGRVRQDIGPHYDHLEFLSPEDEDMKQYVDGLPEAGSKELLDSLEELEEEGLIDLKHGTTSVSASGYKSYEDRPETEIIDYEGEFEIEDYHQLDREEKELLEKLDEKGAIDLEQSRTELEIEEKYARYEINLDGKAEKVRSDEEVTIGADYERSTEYEVDDELQRIAENLDPLNLEKDSYEEIEVETSFRYENSGQATV